MGATTSASKSRQLLVSFSGMDGAGKSTQIAKLRALVERSGMRVTVRAFWDDVVVGTRFREDFSHKVLKSEKGIGAPGKPVERRDKNIRSWYLNVARYAMYFADAVNLAWVVRRIRKTGGKVVIFDRYIYDQLANLPLENPFARAYIALINLAVPRPDMIFFLDADPVGARARKPEYPVHFLEQNRHAYLRLAELIGGVTIVPPLPLTDALQRVSSEFTKTYPATPNAASSLVASADHFSSTPAA